MERKSAEDLIEAFADNDNDDLSHNAVSMLLLQIVDLQKEIEKHLDTIAYLKEYISKISEESFSESMGKVASYYYHN